MSLKNPFEYIPFQERDVQNREYGELLEKIKPILEEESENLKNEGLPVDNECRINPDFYEGTISKTTIDADKQSVKKAESKFKEINPSGELLEIVKTIAFNRLWFNERIVSVRTSRFDDEINQSHVDELIFDRETLQIIAASDVTTKPDYKEKDLLTKVKDGAVLKYGLRLDKDGFKKESLKNVPYFIVRVKPDDLIGLAENIIQKGNAEVPENIKQNLLQNLIIQCDKFMPLARPDLKESYKKAQTLFEELLSRSKTEAA